MSGWISACGNATCIEVQALGPHVELRSTGCACDGGAVIKAETPEWLAFVAGVKRGDFDDITP